MRQITLKDGSTIKETYKHLDRLIDFDGRSRDYPIRQLLKKKKRRSYTWALDKYLDQGREGACVGFGITHELAARPAKAFRRESIAVCEKYARETVYWGAQKIDPWAGGAYPGASPYYEGTSVLAGVQVAHKAGWFKTYRWAFGLEDLILGVGYNGPAVLGLRWYEGMVRPDHKGFIRPTGAVIGGHCILCNKVDVRREFFGLPNSWGTGWGDCGNCYITFSDMEKLLQAQGEACFFIRRRSKPRP